MQQRIPTSDRLDAFVATGWITREQIRELGIRVAQGTRRFLLSDVLSIFLATRLGFLLLTYFGLALLRDPALVGDQRIGFHGYLMDQWFYRDSQWYLTIATDGYHYFGPGHRSTVAFFPLYPLLIKLLHLCTTIDYGICAMLIANLAFLGALIFLYKLCHREFGEGVARRAMFYMAVFPTAFFSFAPYSESLFLLLTISSLYYMRGQRWWLAGLCGGLAAATRILGVLLILAFVWEYLRVHEFKPRRMLKLDALGATLIPAGLGAYMLYLVGLTGDAMAFVKSEAGWNRSPVWPWQVLITSLKDVPKTGIYPYFQAHALIENGLVITCLVILVLGLREVPLSFILFGLACISVLLSAPVVTSMVPLTSMSRYVLVLVPVFIVLARWGRWAIFDRLYTLLSVGGLAIFTTLFLNHMWGA